jgi:hypothetical protein
MTKGFKTGGRRKGTPNRVTAATAAAIAASGLTPLDYMLGVLRDASAAPELRMAAAKASAPYCHPRLAATILIDGEAEDDIDGDRRFLEEGRNRALALTLRKFSGGVTTEEHAELHRLNTHLALCPEGNDGG